MRQIFVTFDGVKWTKSHVGKFGKVSWANQPEHLLKNIRARMTIFLYSMM